jgi:hypothetical protein
MSRAFRLKLGGFARDRTAWFSNQDSNSDIPELEFVATIPATENFASFGEPNASIIQPKNRTSRKITRHGRISQKVRGQRMGETMSGAQA